MPQHSRDSSLLKEAWPAPHRRTFKQEIQLADTLDLDPTDVLILKAMSYGLNTEETADMLVIPLDTIKSRLKHIRSNLKAKNTPHAIANALRAGVIS